MLELNVNAAPYAILLVAMTILASPYFKGVLQSGSITVLEWKIELRHLGIALCYLLYIIFATFRQIDVGYGGVDAPAYLSEFNMAQNYDFITYMTEVTTFEPVYSAVSWAIGKAFGDFRFALFFWHTLAFVTLVLFMRATLGGRRYVQLIIAAFFLLLFTMFNTLRMTAAIAIALNALTLIRDNKWGRSVLVVALAVCVQASAAIMVPVIIVNAIMKNRAGYSGLKLVALLAVMGLLSVGAIGLFASALSHFSKSVYIGGSGISFGVYLAALVITVLGFANRKRLDTTGGMAGVLLASLPVCIICLPLQMNFSIVYRMVMYFVPITYALSPMLWVSYRRDCPSLSQAFVFLFCNVYCIYRFVEFFTMDNLGRLVLQFQF